MSNALAELQPLECVLEEQTFLAECIALIGAQNLNRTTLSRKLREIPGDKRLSTVTQFDRHLTEIFIVY